MGSEADNKLHVVFFPFMAQGHMIPMLDIARLFAARGVKATVITTPLNSLQFVDVIDRDMKSGLDIRAEIIPFPGVEAGLPQGCENQASVPSQELMMSFFKAVAMLEEPFDQLLQQHRPDCVVTDMFLPWTTDVASKYGIPRIVFHGKCYFPMCVSENIKLFKPQEKVESDSELFIVPGLPDPIKMFKSQMRKPDANSNILTSMLARVQEAEAKSYGVLVNSFYEMEPAYADYYRKDMGRRAWNIGPVSLYNRYNIVDNAQRGMKASIDDHTCLGWLDSKQPNSVLYVSFGSLFRCGRAQLTEIAMGLEASKIPFIWVVRMKTESSTSFLPEGYEERIQGRGLIIKGWAPQLLILDHPAVGGFMTHCGWNSTSEAISAGIPLITWPMFAEQFQNEQLVTQVLKIGIESGNRIFKLWADEETVSVTRQKIEEVVTKLMDCGTEAEDMRRRAKELGKTARRAVEEGGSSYKELTILLEQLSAHK